VARSPGPALAAALAAAAFPDLGRRLCDQLADADPALGTQVHDDPLLARTVSALADASRSLSRLVVADPAALAQVIAVALADEADRDALIAAALTAAREPAPLDAVRVWRQRAFLRIAVRDLLGLADLPSVGRELAALGDACLHAALTLAEPELPLAVMGMGKLGGDELNYASDVDVVFVHQGDAAAAQRACRRLVNVMTEVRGTGLLFRTDADLRPEGPQGALSRTADSYAAYFERWAEPWERQAYIKMRYVAGDVAVANHLFDVVREFVWDRDLEPGAVGYLRRLKGRAEDHRGASADVKRGPGGIRDVEFGIQLLQLVHGRADRGLRSPTTLEALDQLVRAGLVDQADADTLHAAYVHLRTVEHRLQLRDERQTHSLPETAEDLRWLARVLGYRDHGHVSATEAFQAEHRRHRHDVRRIHESLFHRPILEAIAGSTVNEHALHERLRALGFSDPEQVSGSAERLTAGLSRNARAMRHVFPLVLDALAQSPDPDLGLVRLGWITDGPTRSNAVVGALRDSPVAVDRLCWLLGSSRVVADGLRRHPDLVRGFLHGDAIAAARDPDELREGALAALSLRPDADARDDEVRRFVRREQLRVAVRDLLNVASVDTIGAELSAIADAAMAAAVDQLAPAVPFAVIALGRYGAAELSYPSDLDVIFAYEGSGHEAAGGAMKTATRLLHRLGAHTREGRTWEIDARLRPDGEKGQIARSLEGYRRYYEERAQLWERQALIKARAAAGDAALGVAFLELADQTAFGRPFGDAETDEIVRMKRRIETERADAATRARDLKLGPGGMTDVEFLVQLLQLRHGVRAASTVAAIDLLGAAGHLDPADAATLVTAYRLAERTRNRGYLQTGRPADIVPDDPVELRSLARSLGYTDRPVDTFLAERQRATTAARAVVDRRFYGVGPLH
jgi:glutamate-ammonia-ligase adenylyltransferase